MNRTADPVKAENDRKDLLIMRLKADVFEMRQRDRDYKILHEQYIQLKHQYQRQAEEKARMEAQQQFKMENQYSVQRKLARELDDLKATLEEHMKKTTEYDRELSY